MTDINPGIRKTVKWLADMGFEVAHSDDGNLSIKGEDYDAEVEEFSGTPHVFIHVADPTRLVDEADKLRRLIERVCGEVHPHLGEGDPECSILARYDPVMGKPEIILLNVYDEILDPYDTWDKDGENL